MLRLDMSEYMERHSVAKLIGAPPGSSSWSYGILCCCDIVQVVLEHRSQRLTERIDCARQL